MLDITAVPPLHEYVAGQLYDYCDGIGHFATVRGLPSGEVLVDVEQSDGSFLTVYVDRDGTLLENDRHMRPVRLRGFDWHAEPTDTGRVHGPAAQPHRRAEVLAAGLEVLRGPVAVKHGTTAAMLRELIATGWWNLYDVTEEEVRVLLADLLASGAVSFEYRPGATRYYADAPGADLEPGTRVLGIVPGGERVAGTVVAPSGARVIAAGGPRVLVRFDGRTSPVPFAVAQLLTPRSAVAAALVRSGIAPGPVLA